MIKVLRQKSRTFSTAVVGKWCAATTLAVASALSVVAPAASAATSDAEVGVPAGGVAASTVPAVAPDGTRITGFSVSPRPFVHLRHGESAARSGVNVTIATSGARLRASVPGGAVLALAFPNDTAYAGCKIPGSDGYAWGYLDIDTPQGWRTGWMRQDLWYVTEFTGPGDGGNGTPTVPWC